MSSIYSGSSGRSGRGFLTDNVVFKFWDENVKGILFGVFYAMVKDKSTHRFSKVFLIASFVIEFFEMIILCFRDAFNWGKLGFSFDFNYSMFSFTAYEIVYWFVVSVLLISFLNFAYVGYTFYKGEIRQGILLKSMRWFINSYLTILFMPMLFILFISMGCNYDTHKLHMYPSEPCGGSTTVLAVIGLIFAVVFVLCCFLSVLSCFEHDPTVVKACGRLQNRFEFVVVFVKLAIVIMATIVNNKPEAFLAVSSVSTFLLFVGSVSVLPFYDHKLNIIRSGSFAGIFYVNLGMVVAYLMDDSSSVPVVVFTAGIPVACALGAFIADRRFKYLCDPALVDGVISSEEMQSMPVQQGKKKKSVNFEQPKANKLLKNRLYTRLRFPWDVEIAARFIVYENPNSALIEKAKIVYQTGLSKFPKSPTVLQGYANFMFTTVGDWQLGYVILEKLRKMSMIMDIQFFIYSYDKDRVRRTEGGHDRIGDFVDFMEFKKLQQQARRHHMTCLVCVRKFWQYLLEPKVDVMQLSLLSSKIALAEKKATEQYAKLIANHPKNVSILRDYAKFLDEVILDEKSSYEVRKKADKYEHEEMESATESHRNSNPAHGVTPEDGNSEHESEIRSEHSVESWEERTVSSKSSGVNAKLVEARLDKFNSLKKLGYIMLATTAFVIAVAIVEVIVLNDMLTNYNNNFEAQNTAGGAAHSAMISAKGVVESWYIGKRSFEYGVGYLATQATTTSGLINMANNIKSLYYGDSDAGSFASQRFLLLKEQYGFPIYQDITNHDMSYSEFNYKSASVIKFFSETRYNQSTYISDSNLDGFSEFRQYEKAGLWQITSVFMANVYDVLSLKYTDFSDPSKLRNHYASLSFILDNSPSLSIGMNDLVNYYAKSISNAVDQIIMVCLIIFCIATGLLILAVLGFFRPIVRKIFESKVRTYTMFTLIPTSVVRLMTKKKIVNMNKRHDSDDEDDYTTDEDAKKKTKEKGFTKWNSKSMIDSDNDHEHEDDKVYPTTTTLTVSENPSHSVAEEQKILLPHSTDTPDDTNVISIRPAAYDSSKIDDQIYHPPSSTLNASGVPNLALSLPRSPNKVAPSEVIIGVQDEPEQKGESVGLVMEESKEKEKEAQHLRHHVKPLGFGKLFANKITGLVDRIRGNTYRKIESEEDRKEEKEEKHKHSKKSSKLDVSSLDTVTRNMHFSYLIAIAVIIGGLLAGFLVMREYLTALLQISTRFQNADLRTQYVHTVCLDLAVLTLNDYNSSTATQYRMYTQNDLETFWNSHKAIVLARFQMELFYDSDCPNIDQTTCTPKDSEYYPLVQHGLNYALYSFYTLGNTLLTTSKDTLSQINATSEDYIKFRYLSEIVLDGTERATFNNYKNAKQQIADTKQYIGVITAVESIGFLFVYLILFRPFVKKLRAENEHTFSLIRMIPRKLLSNVPEIQEFIQETLDTNEDD